MTQAGRLYGGSLYDLAAEEQLTDTIHEQMEQLKELFREEPEYLKLLSEPSIPKEERIGLIDKALSGQVEKYLVNFIKLLCEKNKLGQYEECCKEFTQRYYDEHGIAEAKVISAVALNEEQKASLKAKLEKMSGKQIIIIEETDPSVVAGIRVELEGIQYDGTVQSRLGGLSKKINEIIV